MSVERKTRDMNRYKEDAVIEAVYWPNRNWNESKINDWWIAIRSNFMNLSNNYSNIAIVRYYSVSLLNPCPNNQKQA